MLDVCAENAGTLTFEPRGPTCDPHPFNVYTHPHSPSLAQTALPGTHGDRQMDVERPRMGRRRWFGVMLLNSSQHNSGWLIWTAVHRIHPS